MVGASVAKPASMTPKPNNAERKITGKRRNIELSFLLRHSNVTRASAIRGPVNMGTSLNPSLCRIVWCPPAHVCAVGRATNNLGTKAGTKTGIHPEICYWGIISADGTVGRRALLKSD
jgi:hypothetical protein